MLVGILVPAVIIAAVVIGFFAWYRRKIASMAPTEAPVPSGIRLTSERLRSLPHPPWRVVYEIAPERLDGIDHVVVGPPGAVAIRTVVGDRPAPTGRNDDATAVAAAAVRRGPVDELATRAGGRCDHTLVVYWGTPDPDAAPAFETAIGEWAVEGQRLIAWLITLPPGSDDPVDVDAVWQAITTGIGRPDPLG